MGKIRIRMVAAAMLGLMAAAHSGDSFATVEKVGVIGAANPAGQAIGEDQTSRVLSLGSDIHFKDRIVTDERGNAQLLFNDKSALTVGPSSSLTIDEFVYNPADKSGHLAVEGTKGVFRFVGGALSKHEPVVIKTPVSTIGIRGGIVMVEVNPQSGATSATFVYGIEMTVKNLKGVLQSTMAPGSMISVASGLAAPTPPVKVDMSALAASLARLEGGKGTNGGATQIPDHVTIQQKITSGIPAPQNAPAPVTLKPLAPQSLNEDTAAPVPAPGSTTPGIVPDNAGPAVTAPTVAASALTDANAAPVVAAVPPVATPTPPSAPSAPPISGLNNALSQAASQVASDTAVATAVNDGAVAPPPPPPASTPTTTGGNNPGTSPAGSTPPVTAGNSTVYPTDPVSTSFDFPMDSGSTTANIDGKVPLVLSANTALPSTLQAAHCTQCSFVDWGVWKTPAVSGALSAGTAAKIDPSTLTLGVAGQVTQNIAGRLTGPVTYTGTTAGEIHTAASLNGQIVLDQTTFGTGTFNATVDLTNRILSGFTSTLTSTSAQVNIGLTNGQYKLNGTGNATNSSAITFGDNIKGAGTMNVALFGPNAENIGGTYTFAGPLAAKGLIPAGQMTAIAVFAGSR